MFLSVAVSAVAGYVVLMALNLKMPSPGDVLANSGGYGVGLHPRARTSVTASATLGGLLAAGIAIAMTFCGFSSSHSQGECFSHSVATTASLAAAGSSA